MTDKERIEKLKDFLGNELKIGDNVVINQNTRTGSSTIRKMLKRATILGFTRCQVITTEGRIYPDDVIKISNANQNAKAVEALERLKKNLEIEYINNPIIYNEIDDTVGACFDRDKCFETIDNLIKEYGGKNE